MDILNLGDNDMQVLHVPGVDNAVADALSRADFHRAVDLIPSLKISTFEPWSWSLRFFRERPEKTAVLGPVGTGLGPNRDGRYIALYFL